MSCCAVNGTEWKNYIYFRDYINANEDVTLQYRKLKKELEKSMRTIGQHIRMASTI